MPLHRRLRWSARIVLLVGLVGAGLTYATAPDAAADIDLGSGYDDTLERIGGRAAVRVAHFDHWLGSLAHGRPLAITLAVLTVVVAALCCGLAALVDDSPDDPGPR